MTPYDTKDPWATDSRIGYVPPPQVRRERSHRRSIDVGRLLRTVLMLAGLLWAFNYALQNSSISLR